jgi:hypothetical protein
MALTISETRYQEIRRLVQERKIAREAAEIDAETDWNRQTAFSDIDSLLAYLDRLPATEDRPSRSRRKRR